MKWELVDWDDEPAVYMPGFARVYRKGRWESANSSSVGHQGKQISEANFKKKFGKLALPPLPSKG